ncbi:MAG: response regulator [Oligoflexia bacterium]|nr:response regulator [Oligoflexia bacterium]
MTKSKEVKLLVVDEHDQYCTLIQEHAELYGHSLKIVCECVNSGREALERITKWEPSVVLLDAHLPDMNSFEVLDACRNGRATVVVSSEVCSREIEDSARAHGASGYVTKSDNPEDIEALLYELATVSLPVPMKH